MRTSSTPSCRSPAADSAVANATAVPGCRVRSRNSSWPTYPEAPSTPTGTRELIFIETEEYSLGIGSARATAAGAGAPMRVAFPPPTFGEHVMIQSLALSVLGLALAPRLGAQAPAPRPRPFTPDDVLRVRDVREPRISPKATGWSTPSRAPTPPWTRTTRP